jgi:hypothetical protein
MFLDEGYGGDVISDKTVITFIRKLWLSRRTNMFNVCDTE